MRSVMGLISVDAGDVRWKGRPITPELRHRFGYMPAERGMYPKMRVHEQLVYFARLAGRTAADAKVAADHWLERLGLTDRAGDEVQALSSGNQQRVQLAIALVHDPELLILDEPFSGLDPIAVETMKQLLLEQVARGVAVLFSSHQLDLVTDICRDVVIVDRGASCWKVTCTSCAGGRRSATWSSATSRATSPSSCGCRRRRRSTMCSRNWRTPHASSMAGSST